MAFSSLEQLVGGLESRPQWQSHQRFQQILDCWTEVVGAVVAAQTCPLSIQRHVLIVSTSSAVWAQNLAFQRPHILKKLTAYIPNHSLKDIRFSPAKWADIQATQPQEGKGRSLKQYHLEQSVARSLWSYHPSHITHRSTISSSTISKSPSSPPPSQNRHRKPALAQPSPDTPTQVFHHWADRIQKRSQHLPKCPRCHCPTPLGELKRWSVCALCAAKEW